jgi:hypothetical protein
MGKLYKFIQHFLISHIPSNLTILNQFLTKVNEVLRMKLNLN